MMNLAVARNPSVIQDGVVIYYRWDLGIFLALHEEARTVARFNQGHPGVFLIQSRDQSPPQIQ